MGVKEQMVYQMVRIFLEEEMEIYVKFDIGKLKWEGKKQQTFPEN